MCAHVHALTSLAERKHAAQPVPHPAPRRPPSCAPPPTAQIAMQGMRVEMEAKSEALRAAQARGATLQDQVEDLTFRLQVTVQL